MSRAPGSVGDTSSPLLTFEGVCKSYPDGRRRIPVLEQASFAVYPRDFIGILGTRRTGKSTLLRLAAGIDSPDKGTICFAGRDLAQMPAIERERLLRAKIGLLASDDWRPGKGERVVDLVALPLISDRATLHEARRVARKMLQWTGATEYADDLAESLSMGERMRVMLARTLVREPPLVLVDEPAVVPSPTERDDFYKLLRRWASEREATLIVASEDASAVRGATVEMSIAYGELNSTGEPSVILPFPDKRVGGMGPLG